MLVSEILRIKGNALFTTTPDAPVVDAVKVMAQHDIGSLVVMDHGRLVGILTFREVLGALATRGGTLGGLANREILAQAIRTAAVQSDQAEYRGDNGHGQLYVLHFPLTTAKGTATVLTAWIIRHNEDFPRLITCYIL